MGLSGPIIFWDIAWINQWWSAWWFRICMFHPKASPRALAWSSDFPSVQIWGSTFSRNSREHGSFSNTREWWEWPYMFIGIVNIKPHHSHLGDCKYWIWGFSLNIMGIVNMKYTILFWNPHWLHDRMLFIPCTLTHVRGTLKIWRFQGNPPHFQTAHYIKLV